MNQALCVAVSPHQRRAKPPFEGSAFVFCQVGPPQRSDAWSQWQLCKMPFPRIQRRFNVVINIINVQYFTKGSRALPKLHNSLYQLLKGKDANGFSN